MKTFKEFALSSDPVTQTKPFFKWFKGSKVINKNGEPKIVYHLSVNEFGDQFTETKPIFFADNLNEITSALSKNRTSKSFYLRLIKPYILNCENRRWSNLPKDNNLFTNQKIINSLNSLEKNYFYSDYITTDLYVKAVITLNKIKNRIIYDGIIFNDIVEAETPIGVYVTFYPNQIKSATTNNGNFNLDDPRFDYQGNQ